MTEWTSGILSMYRSHKVPIHEIRSMIKEISIMHRTGQTRIITTDDEVIDVKFKDLVTTLNTIGNNFARSIKVKYCPFTHKQLEKLVTQTCYRYCEKTVKNKELGYLETCIEFREPPKQIKL